MEREKKKSILTNAFLLFATFLGAGGGGLLKRVGC